MIQITEGGEEEKEREEGGGKTVVCLDARINSSIIVPYSTGLCLLFYICLCVNLNLLNIFYLCLYFYKLLFIFNLPIALFVKLLICVLPLGLLSFVSYFLSASDCLSDYFCLSVCLLDSFCLSFWRLTLSIFLSLSHSSFSFSLLRIFANVIKFPIQPWWLGGRAVVW